MGDLKVQFSKRARQNLKKISSWWHENRTAAPTMFDDEVAGAVELLAHTPYAGQEAGQAKNKGRRVLVLKGSQHVIIYRIRTEVVVLLAIQSTRQNRK